LTLPVRDLLHWPGARLAREHEIELEQGAQLAGVLRAPWPEHVEDRVDTAGRMSGPAGPRGLGSRRRRSGGQAVRQGRDRRCLVLVCCERVASAMEDALAHPLSGEQRRGVLNRLWQVEDDRPQSLVPAAKSNRIVAAGPPISSIRLASFGTGIRLTASPAVAFAIARMPRWYRSHCSSSDIEWSSTGSPVRT